MPYELSYTSKFRKSLKKIVLSGKFKIELLETVLNILKERSRLPEKYKDHELNGKLKGLRECHIKGDLLLIYEVDKDERLIILHEIGSHSYLFG